MSVRRLDLRLPPDAETSEKEEAISNFILALIGASGRLLSSEKRLKGILAHICACFPEVGEQLGIQFPAVFFGPWSVSLTQCVNECRLSNQFQANSERLLDYAVWTRPHRLEPLHYIYHIPATGRAVQELPRRDELLPEILCWSLLDTKFIVGWLLLLELYVRATCDTTAEQSLFPLKHYREYKGLTKANNLDALCAELVTAGLRPDGLAFPVENVSFPFEISNRAALPERDSASISEALKRFNTFTAPAADSQHGKKRERLISVNWTTEHEGYLRLGFVGEGRGSCIQGERIIRGRDGKMRSVEFARSLAAAYHHIYLTKREAEVAYLRASDELGAVRAGSKHKLYLLDLQRNSFFARIPSPYGRDEVPRDYVALSDWVRDWWEDQRKVLSADRGCAEEVMEKTANYTRLLHKFHPLIRLRFKDVLTALTDLYKAVSAQQEKAPVRLCLKNDNLRREVCFNMHFPKEIAASYYDCMDENVTSIQAGLPYHLWALLQPVELWLWAAGEKNVIGFPNNSEL